MSCRSSVAIAVVPAWSKEESVEKRVDEVEEVEGETYCGEDDAESHSARFSCRVAE